MNKASFGLALALLLSGQVFAQQAGETKPAPEAPAAAPASPPAAAPAPDSPPAAAPAAGPMKVIVGRDMSYIDANNIAKAVLAECQLPQQGAQMLVSAMRAAGFEPVVDDQAAQAAKGRVLLVQISDAVAGGNAFIGHRKQVNVRGRLLQDGKEVATFTGIRSSMGGAFGGFKGSCSVLQRCLETLSKDISTWLKNPVSGRIGE
jgi:hypothetical protein